MAAGGGMFTVQNKGLPGSIYKLCIKSKSIRYIGRKRSCCIAIRTGDWGGGNVITIENEEFQTNCMKILGYSYTDDEVLYLREVFKGANTVKLLE